MAYLKQNPAHAVHGQKLVLSPTDAPQLGTLPDLAPVIRSMLLHSNLEACGFILSPLYAALPCVRRPQTVRCGDAAQAETHPAAICLLLGLLLGLYPTSVKFPPFHVRVSLYRRIHSLLTNGGGLAFCSAHPSILALAAMEYVACVIPLYLPVEHALLLEEHGMPAFFLSCSMTCDAFRQEALETGEEPWGALEAYCTPLVDRHLKACRNRQRARKAMIESQQPALKIQPASVEQLIEVPFVVPYAIHQDDPTDCIMSSEMSFLGILKTNTGQNPTPSQPPSVIQNPSSASNHVPTQSLNPGPTPSPDYSMVVAIQRTIHAHELPPNLTKMQLRSLDKNMRVCERSALSASILHVCVACVMANQQTICKKKGSEFPTRGQCKLDLETGELVCSIPHCQSKAILSISTLGRIVSIRGHRFYLAPCCATVQTYTGRGDEFQCCDEDNEPPFGAFQAEQEKARRGCPHQRDQPSKGKVSSAKKRCELCSNVALQEPHHAIDHLTGEKHCTFLCQRHTPHPEVLKRVVNWKQLQEEIRARDKPLFSVRKKDKKV